MLEMCNTVEFAELSAHKIPQYVVRQLINSVRELVACLQGTNYQIDPSMEMLVYAIMRCFHEKQMQASGARSNPFAQAPRGHSSVSVQLPDARTSDTV